MHAVYWLLIVHVLHRENKLKGNFNSKNLEVTNLGEEEAKNSMYDQQKWPNPPARSCHIVVKLLLLIGTKIHLCFTLCKTMICTQIPEDIISAVNHQALLCVFS